MFVLWLWHDIHPEAEACLVVSALQPIPVPGPNPLQFGRLWADVCTFAFGWY